jgi:quercetin dioxygenase-like cupin family protein
VAALSAGTALATAPSGEMVTPLGRGPLVKPVNINERVGMGRVKIQTTGSLDALTVQSTLAPGGTGGWHKHAGPHIMVVAKGTLTVIDARCKRHEVPAGHANIDSAGDVDKVENLGSTPAVIYVTFLLPHGISSPRIDAPAPAGCTA